MNDTVNPLWSTGRTNFINAADFTNFAIAGSGFTV